MESMEKLKEDLRNLAILAERFGIPPTYSVRRFAVIIALNNNAECVRGSRKDPELQQELYGLLDVWLEEDVEESSVEGVMGEC